MKIEYKLFALSIAVFAAVGCAVDPKEAPREDRSLPTETQEASVAEPDAVTELASECATLWTCEPCLLSGNPGNRNILIQECPDGSIIVKQRRPCGEDCF